MTATTTPRNWPAQLIPPEALAAWHALRAALAGIVPPCAANPDAWFDGDDDTAAAACRACPATTECLNYGRAIDARAGVWGGRSLTKKR